MKKIKRLFVSFLPLLLVAVMLAGTAQAALLDFGPIVPEVVGSTPPNLRTGFPAWFRDSNRVPLQLCLEEVPGCLFAAVDRPDLNLPLAFPNIPDELFYYSATALIGDQLLFAGVEMNFADNGDGTYEQVGFVRVRIRIDSTVAGDYTITTPWKQYFFTVDQATITANAGRRVINATEDIGLGPDGVFTGALLGTVDTFIYSVGAPFVTAAGSFLGTGAALTVIGSKFTDPVTGQPANIFRIQGPPGFTTVSTNQFAITGKLYPDPIPTPLIVDKLTYARDAAGVQVSAFATTQPLSNQVNGTLAFPLNFALTGVPSALQVSGAGLPTQGMTTNNPKDGKFFSTSGVFAVQGNLPADATVTNTADTPNSSTVVPLVDQVVIDKADYNPLTSTLSIAAVSHDSVSQPVLQAFIAGTDVLLGTLANGLLDVTFPVTFGPVTYNIPPLNVTVESAIGGSATAPVSVVIPTPPVAPTLLTGSGTATPATQTYTWAAVSNATSYTLYNNFDNTQTIFTAAAVGCAGGVGTCTANQTKLIPFGTAVGILVSATNSGGTSPWSTAASFTILDATPVAQTLLIGSGNASPAQTYLWPAVSNAISYTLYNNFDNSQTIFTAADVGCGAGTGTCTATQTKAIPFGTAVGILVSATNSGGTSPWSTAASFTILDIAPVAPTAFTGSGTAAPDTQTYTWSAVSNATIYTLYNNFDNSYTDITPLSAGCELGTGTCTFIQTKAIPFGTSVGNLVRASNLSGPSPWSDAISYTIQ